MDRKTIEVDFEMWQARRREILRLQNENERLQKQLNKPVSTGTEAAVCEDIARRQEFGLNKYGTSVAANPLELREWLNHAYEESLDYPIYLKRAIQEIDKTMANQVNADLLEALKYCRQKIAYMTEHGEWYSPGRAIEMADEAIAAAERHQKTT